MKAHMKVPFVFKYKCAGLAVYLMFYSSYQRCHLEMKGVVFFGAERTVQISFTRALPSDING